MEIFLSHIIAVLGARISMAIASLEASVGNVLVGATDEFCRWVSGASWYQYPSPRLFAIPDVLPMVRDADRPRQLGHTEGSPQLCGTF
jgi:hypothetical protein